MKHRLIAAILMSFGLSLLMSCWVTLINLGWSDSFVAQWMAAFRLAWPPAAILAFLLGPPAQTLAGYLANRLPKFKGSKNDTDPQKL
ncbi:DUF2798 domain-containing protein [Roseibium porphyridii]|uniref:DUF2798 domain-containing protein n=1 Tax=Roseibium porphyridii TaxID=2866279 RepID=A0ABY8F9X3_9HYPH|nr:DUF2798 domain-containing protein [Roseibium sp. KMA01]WFE92131.1 DUF2798 domain-containing protein [Roseibium sp. KMA01]